LEAGPGVAKPRLGGGPAFEIRRASVGSSGHSSVEGVWEWSNRLPLTGYRGWLLQSAGVRLGVRSSSSGRQRKTTLSARGRKRREPEGAARGDLDRVPTRIGQRPRSRLPRPRKRHEDPPSDEYVLPKLVERRQAPHDPSCSPEFIFDGRAGRVSDPSTSGFVRSSCKCTCLRVGCRSRSGASSPVSCGGVRGSRASVVRVRLRCRRGSVRWEPVSVGRRRAVCST